MQQVSSSVRMHAAMTCRAGHPVLDTAVHEAQLVMLQYAFAYATVWGIGGCLDSNSWDAWDKAIRGVFDGLANYPSGAGNVFDYYVHVSK